VLQPLRAGHRPQPIGRKGKSRQRGIGGAKLCLLLKPLGVGVAWECAGATAPDSACPPLLAALAQERSVWRDPAFPAQEGAPPTRKLWARGTWTTRRLVETVLAMLTGGCQVKQVRPRPWAAFQARLAFTLVTFNLLGPWHGLNPDTPGLIRRSLAEFSL